MVSLLLENKSNYLYLKSRAIILKIYFALVMDFIKEAISKSREIIDCDFQHIRRICDPEIIPCCYGDGCCERKINRSIEELWREVQCKLSKVSCMMDRIDRLRSNGWKW